MLTDAQHAQTVHPGVETPFIYTGDDIARCLLCNEICQMAPETCECEPCPNCHGVEQADDCPDHRAVDRGRVVSREEQHARYIDCGPAAWDDRD